MSDSSFLEYLFELHKGQLRKSSDFLALFCHAMLLNKKAKLQSGKAILPEDWNLSDPIRLAYQSSDGIDINVSVVETNGDVFISVTESKNDQLGHLELAGDDFVDSGAGVTLAQAYPQLGELTKRFEDSIWSVLFPPKKTETARKNDTEPIRSSFTRPDPLVDHRYPTARAPFDYGRSDLDPFGLGSHPLGHGPGTGGGMFFDPRGNLRGNDFRPLYPGAPPDAAPPGARIDPIYPNPLNPRPGRGRGSHPDPDMPTPPGWEDMYL